MTESSTSETRVERNKKNYSAVLSSSTYDVMKHTVQLVLPALGTLYFTLAQIWGLPNAEQVVGSIVAVNTFLGVIVSIAAHRYNNSPEKFDGSIDIIDTGEKKVYSLNLDGDPDELDQRDEVIFKINS